MRVVNERVPRLVTAALMAAMVAAGAVEAMTGGAGGRLAAWRMAQNEGQVPNGSNGFYRIGALARVRVAVVAYAQTLAKHHVRGGHRKGKQVFHAVCGAQSGYLANIR